MGKPEASAFPERWGRIARIPERSAALRPAAFCFMVGRFWDSLPDGLFRGDILPRKHGFCPVPAQACGSFIADEFTEVGFTGSGCRQSRHRLHGFDASGCHSLRIPVRVLPRVVFHLSHDGRSPMTGLSCPLASQWFNRLAEDVFLPCGLFRIMRCRSGTFLIFTAPAGKLGSGTAKARIPGIPPEDSASIPHAPVIPGVISGRVSYGSGNIIRSPVPFPLSCFPLLFLPPCTVFSIRDKCFPLGNILYGMARKKAAFVPYIGLSRWMDAVSPFWVPVSFIAALHVRRVRQNIRFPGTVKVPVRII